MFLLFRHFNAPAPSRSAVAPLVGLWLIAFGALSSFAESDSLTLAISGRRHSELKPCGCRVDQLGGLDREAAILDELRDGGAPVLIDAGGFIDLSLQEPEKEKSAYLLRGLQRLGFDAVNVGFQDMGYTLADLRSDAGDLPLISANIVSTSPTVSLAFDPFVVVERNGRRLGIVGVTQYRGQLSEAQRWNEAKEKLEGREAVPYVEENGPISHLDATASRTRQLFWEPRPYRIRLLADEETANKETGAAEKAPAASAAPISAKDRVRIYREPFEGNDGFEQPAFNDYIRMLNERQEAIRRQREQQNTQFTPIDQDAALKAAYDGSIAYRRAMETSPTLNAGMVDIDTTPSLPIEQGLIFPSNVFNSTRDDYESAYIPSPGQLIDGPVRIRGQQQQMEFIPDLAPSQETLGSDNATSGASVRNPMAPPASQKPAQIKAPGKGDLSSEASSSPDLDVDWIEMKERLARRLANAPSCWDDNATTAASLYYITDPNAALRITLEELSPFVDETLILCFAPRDLAVEIVGSSTERCIVFTSDIVGPENLSQRHGDLEFVGGSHSGRALTIGELKWTGEGLGRSSYRRLNIDADGPCSGVMDDLYEEMEKDPEEIRKKSEQSS